MKKYNKFSIIKTIGVAKKQFFCENCTQASTWALTYVYFYGILTVGHH